MKFIATIPCTNFKKNRNPYIDNPEWACYIYGDTNEATQSLCAASAVEPTSISLTPSTASLNMGSTLTLSASVLPSGAPSGVTWSSSNQSIATVANGIVTPISTGVVTITATSTANNTIYGSSIITVTNDTIPVTGVFINQASVNLTVGNSTTLNATVLPNNASNKSITWSSSNPSIASISNSGVVSGLQPGSGMITATTSEGGFTDSIPFSISEASLPQATTTFTFNSSGNPKWPITSGFGAYFGSGYGISNASAGGYIKSNQFLADVPLGSLLSIEVVAVTNSPSNTALLSMYGLNRNGERITTINDAYSTPAYSSSSLESISSYARDNPGLLTFQASMSSKIYSLELEISSASSKTLLVEVSVSYAMNTAENQALAFANYVNGEGGTNATNNCEIVLADLLSEFNRLSLEGRNAFENNGGEPYSSARVRLSYLLKWLETNQSSNRNYIFKRTENDNLSILTLVFGLISVCYYYIIHFRNK